MACGCGKKNGTVKPTWIVTSRDGSKQEVTSLTAAMQTARAVGGTYERKR